MKYELMVILNPKQTEKEIEKNLKEIKDFLAENEFDLVDEDIWGLRDLAYPVHGHTRGYYTVLNFSGEAVGVQRIQKDLRIQAGLLRSMLTRVPKDYVLLRYETLATTGKASKISSPAEELTKKVRAKRTTKTLETETPSEHKEKLDQTLQAIIEDKDIDL